MSHRLAFFDSFQPTLGDSPLAEPVGIPISTDPEPKPVHLKVIGQGTISAKSDSHTRFRARRIPRSPISIWLLPRTRACFTTRLSTPVNRKETYAPWLATVTATMTPFDDKYLNYPKGKSAGFLPKGTDPLKHWLSIDRTRGKLRYGRGYCTAALVLFEAELKYKDAKRVWHFFDEKKWGWIHDLRIVDVSQAGGSGKLLGRPTISPFPLVRDLPPYVVKDQDVTLEELESGTVTVFANLPDACQNLYHNVAGPNILLDTPDFPDFSSAIEHSVNTEGCVAYNLLKEKVPDAPGHSFVDTYLRITIGSDLGTSPGIPYVLEIWPAGHQSPIHDHGDACAVIKVLHGSVHAYYFESLQNPTPIGQGAQLQKDDITWISPNNYQVHQLKNESTEGKVCCTIQCYQYASNDRTHCEVFHYRDGDQVIKNFVPDSDMAFGGFKKAIKNEWTEFLKGQGGK